jgi:hypothetical protein
MIRSLSLSSSLRVRPSPQGEARYSLFPRSPSRTACRQTGEEKGSFILDTYGEKDNVQHEARSARKPESRPVYIPSRRGVRHHVIGSPESFTHTAKDLPFTTTNRRQYQSTDIT